MNRYRFKTFAGRVRTVEALRVEFTATHVIFRSGTIFDPVIVLAVLASDCHELTQLDAQS